MMVAAEKFSQVVLHMSVAFGVTYVMTGSMVTGGLAALVEPICNVVLLPYHEKVWKRLRDRWNAGSRPSVLRATLKQ